MQGLKERLRLTLRWSERYTKTDMVYLAKGGFWLSGSQGLSAGLSFVLSIAFAAFVSKEAFGIYKYILSIVGVTAALSMTGMNTAVSRAVARGLDGVFIRSLILQGKWSLLQSAALLAVALWYGWNENMVYAFCFAIAAVAAPASSVLNTYGAYLSGKKLFKESGVMTAISAVIYAATMGTTAYFFPTVPALAAAYFVSSALVNGLLCLIVIRRYGVRSDAPSDPDELRFGMEMSAVNVFGSVVSQLDSILVYQLLGPAQLAIYTFAVMLPDRLRSMFSFIATVGLPKLAERSRAELERYLGGKVLRASIFGLAIGGIYALLAPFAYKLFFPEYTASIVYSQVFAISLVAIAANLSGMGIVSQKMRRQIYQFSFISPLFKLIASVALIWLYGIWGALVARILAYAMQTYLPLYLLGKGKDDLETVSPQSL